MNMNPIRLGLDSLSRCCRVPRKRSFTEFVFALLLPVAGAIAADPLAVERLGDPMKRAKTAFERGDYREAERAYERILAKAPKNLLAMENLGVVRFRAGKLEAAADALLRAISAAPKDDFPHCMLGVVYL
jgi:tetratricopeptide (TPR) repeat protein